MTAGWLNLTGDMIGLRDLRIRRFGTALAAFALYLQLALAGGGMLALAMPDEADALGAHALCLAGEDGAAPPAQPAGGIPVAPVHNHNPFCCLLHLASGIAPQIALAPLPVAYAAVALGGRDSVAFTPGPCRGPANARAPPTLA